MDFLLLVFFWLVFAILVGALGSGRQNGFWFSFLIALILSPLIGLIIALLSDKKKSIQETHKYLACIEEGKKAEFKGQLPAALDFYLDALYYIKKDFPSMKPEKLENKIKELREKISTV